MYEDKALLKSKKVGVQFMGIISILLSQFIAVRYGIDPVVTQAFITALVLGHTGTQGIIDKTLAMNPVAPVILDNGLTVAESPVPPAPPAPPYPLPVPNDTPSAAEVAK